MQIIDALQITGRGLVVVTNVKLRDVGALGVEVRVGMPVAFKTPDGLALTSHVRGLELFSSPFNPNKPFAFVLDAGLAKEDLPVGTVVLFAPETGA